MNDPKLDRNLEDVKTLMEAWKQFHVYMSGVMKGDKEYSGKDENKFLKLKSKIAIYHDTLLRSFENPGREAAATMSGMIEIIERCIMLRQMKKMSTAEMKRMEMDWHDAYLLMNEHIGALEEEQAHLAHISRPRFIAEKLFGAAKKGGINLFTSRAFVGTVVTLAIVVGLIVLPLFDVFSYDFLKNNPHGEKVYYIAEGLLRSTVMPDMPYESWERYWESVSDALIEGAEGAEEGELLFFEQSLDGVERTRMENNFLSRGDLDISQMADSTQSKHHFHLKREEKEVQLLFLFYENADGAAEIAREFNTWKSGLESGSSQAESAANIRAGRDSNVAWFAYSDEEQVVEKVATAIRKKKVQSTE